VLGDECGEEWELAILLFTFGVMVGRERIGAGFEDLTGQFYVTPGTEGFMRALEGLAQACMMVGDAETASAHYSTMLELNPADHQGARYPLLALLLAAKEADAALSLMDIYAEDDTAPMAWGRALAAYQKEGTTATAGAALAAAQRKDARIAPFLTGNRRLTLEELQPGDEEAATIAMLYGPAWEATVGAREWLMRTTGLTQAPPTKAKRSGPRALD
jgi:tetratricopeptide (TPR) repeat protein